MAGKFKRKVIKQAIRNKKAILKRGRLARTKLSTRKFRKKLSSRR